MQTFTANLKHAARNNETLHMGGGTFTPKELQQVAAQLDQLREALYLTLPFVEDHEGDPAYKPQAVAQAVARIRKALGEPTP